MVKMAIAHAEKLYTADEFEQMSEFNQNYELIEGRIVQKPIPTEEHSWIARLIIRAYDKYDYNEKVGRMLQEISTRLNNINSPAPDVAFWTFTRKPIPNRKAASLPAPDLAVEVWLERDWAVQQRLSDARQKCRRYIETGVKVVWAINPHEQVVEIYRAGQAEPELVTMNDILQEESLIPGFQIAVRTLFEC